MHFFVSLCTELRFSIEYTVKPSVNKPLWTFYGRPINSFIHSTTIYYMPTHNRTWTSAD